MQTISGGPDERENSFTASDSSLGTHEDLASWKRMQEITSESELVSVRHTLPITVVPPSRTPAATGSLRSSAGTLLENMSDMTLAEGTGKPFRPLPSRDRVVPPPPQDMEDLE